MRASTVAAAAIVVIAGLMLAAIAQRERLARLPEVLRAAPAPPATARPAEPTTTSLLLATAASTSNVYSRPDRSAEVIAVLPGGQRAAVTGRSQQADWLYIATPPTSNTRGWTPAGALRLEPPALAALPVIDVPALPTATVQATPAPDAPPDPALAEALLLSGGQLEVRVRNAGAGPLTDAILTLSISQLGGEVIGVFRVGPASLPAGEIALVVPPLAITQAGRYRFELTVGAEVPDADKANNILEVTLTPNRG